MRNLEGLTSFWFMSSCGIAPRQFCPNPWIFLEHGWEAQELLISIVNTIDCFFCIGKLWLWYHSESRGSCFWIEGGVQYWCTLCIFFVFVSRLCFASLCVALLLFILLYSQQSPVFLLSVTESLRNSFSLSRDVVIQFCYLLYKPTSKTVVNLKRSSLEIESLTW